MLALFSLAGRDRTDADFTSGAAAGVAAVAGPAGCNDAASAAISAVPGSAQPLLSLGGESN